MNVKDLELEDLYIIEEKPLRVRIGNRELFIKPLSLKQVDVFELMLADLLIKWKDYLQNISILEYPDFRNMKQVEAFSIIWKRLLKKKKDFLRDVVSLICKPYKFSFRYFIKHASYDIVTQCFLATQLLNYDAVKKNIVYLMLKAGIYQHQQTSLATSQRSMVGQKKKSLTPRY